MAKTHMTLNDLAQALSTFRANRDQLHRSDPRWLIEDDQFDVAARHQQAARFALAEACAAGVADLDRADRRRDAVDEVAPSQA